MNTATPNRRWSILMLSMGLSACVSPRENLYVFKTPVVDTAGSAGARTTIVVGPVTLPQEVDRPQVVVHDASRALIVEQEQWAAPLKDTLPRLIADELSSQMPQARFVPAASGAIGIPAARLAVDISRFDVSRSQGAIVTVHWVYRSSNPGSTPLEGDLSAQSGVVGVDFAALVEALRLATVQIADQLAKSIPIQSAGDGRS